MKSIFLDSQPQTARLAPSTRPSVMRNRELVPKESTTTRNRYSTIQKVSAGNINNKKNLGTYDYNPEQKDINQMVEYIILTNLAGKL